MHQPVGFLAVLDVELSGDLGTEVVGVRANSVHAVVRGRDHHGEHLPPRTAEWGGAVHQRAVEIQRSLHRRRIGAHDGDDVPDSPRPLQRRVIQLLQQASGPIWWNNIDIRHRETSFPAVRSKATYMDGQDEQDKTGRNCESTKKRKSRKLQRQGKPRPLNMEVKKRLEAKRQGNLHGWTG